MEHGSKRMACEDCIHYDICLGAFGVLVSRVCDSFKDKSKFIELPCSIGSYCVYKNDIWYIDKILYLGINVFFVSLINMASHRFTRASVEEIQFISEDFEEVDKKLEELNEK